MDNKEYLLSLYNLRKNAQTALKESDNMEAKQAVYHHFGELITDVDEKFVNEEIKATFAAVVAKGLEKIAEKTPQIDELQKMELPENLFDKSVIASFEKAKSEVKKAQIALNKEQFRTGNKKSGTLKSFEQPEDDKEVKALKEEVRRWISRTKKLSDEAKSDAQEKLDKAEFLQVKTDKNNKISVEFGEYQAAFTVSTKACRYEFQNAKFSTYGGLEEVLQDDAQNFIETLARHKGKGKTYKTSLGEQKNKAEKAVKNDDKKQQTQMKKIEEAEAKLLQAQENLSHEWSHIVFKANPHEVYRDIVSEDSFLLQVSGVESQNVKGAMVKAILDERNALWSMFRAPEGENNDNRSYYDKLVDKEFVSAHEEEVKEIISSSYHTSSQSMETSLSLLESKVKSLALKDDFPEEFGTQLMLDKVYQFGMGMYSTEFDENKFKFMNKCFKKYDMSIDLTERKINGRCDEKLNDKIHNTDSKIKTYKKQMTGLLYFMGGILTTAGEKADLLNKAALRQQFFELCKAYDKDSSPEHYWRGFVTSADNQKKACETFNLLNQEYGDKAGEIAEILRQGAELKGDSLHHIVYAYYAPLFGDNPEEVVRQFNGKNNTVETLPCHPAFADIHKDKEHRYNISNGGTVLIKRDGKFMSRTISRCQTGDILQMPVLKVRCPNSQNFQALMQEGMLFITSSGKFVQEPDIKGFFAKEKSMLSGQDILSSGSGRE